MSKTPRSRSYLAWIRTQPCCVTGRTVGVEAAHVRMGNGGGMGLKPSDYRTLPLHADEHRRQHNIGERSYWAEKHMDPDAQIIVHLMRYIGDPKRIIGAVEAAIIAGLECTPAEISHD